MSFTLRDRIFFSACLLGLGLAVGATLFTDRVAAQSETTEGEMEIVAHRGASYDLPENTLAAFNLAWEQGADAIELDIMMSTFGITAVN